MIRRVEQLFETVTGPAWRSGDEDGERLLYNPSGDRRLSYIGWKEGERDIADMGLYFLNEKGGWSEVIGLRYLSSSDKEEVMIMVMARERDLSSPRPSDPHFCYTEIGRSNLLSEGHDLISDKRVLAGRLDLLLTEDEMPAELDLILTASLFVDQVARGEMYRPVLVPKGLFTYEEPVELTQISGASSHSSNVVRAAALISQARNKEELRVAERIYAWVVSQELPASLGE